MKLCFWLRPRLQLPCISHRQLQSNPKLVIVFVPVIAITIIVVVNVAL